jgi:hypothetical protein
LSESYADAGATVTLSWSGAKAGTQNPITGYKIYKKAAGGSYALQKTVSSTSTSGSTTITANSTQGAADKYKIVTKGTYDGLDSGDSAEVTLTTLDYSACGAPTYAVMSKSVAEAGEAVTLSWGGATDGTHNYITGYDIYKSVDGLNFTLLKTVSSVNTYGSTTVTANSTQGALDIYKVKTKGSVSGLDSEFSPETYLMTLSYTACTPPTALSLSSLIVNPGAQVTLSWSGAAAGAGTEPENSKIGGSTVWRTLRRKRSCRFIIP